MFFRTENPLDNQNKWLHESERYIKCDLCGKVLGIVHKCRHAYSSPFRRVGTLVTLSTRLKQPLPPYFSVATFMDKLSQDFQNLDEEECEGGSAEKRNIWYLVWCCTVRGQYNIINSMYDTVYSVYYTRYLGKFQENSTLFKIRPVCHPLPPPTNKISKFEQDFRI